MSNKVLITNSQKAVKVPSGLRILIRRACNAVLEYEHFDRPAEISVTFVDNAAIAELNNQYHNKQYYCPRENLTLNIQNWLEANAQSHRQDKTDPIYRAVKLG